MKDKKLKFEFNETDELQKLIKDVYFSNGNNGKLPKNNNRCIILTEENLYYQILHGLNYDVRLKNNNVIDGTMDFRVEDGLHNIKLYPSSIYCITENNKYSFY